jgi:alkanesulfonate monooxygenase SsuD/methylene tetrahydromethanopterin reductase-like flavin-dependent oxidoreductase (luciferase family)
MIRFGIVIPQEGLRYTDIRKVVWECEKLGFDSIWVYDHVFWSDKPFLECWTVLSALALETQKLRLGTLVVNNSFRYPSLLAKMAATLDVITKGRLELGIGAGTSRSQEYLAYGIPFAKPSIRIRQLKEAVQIIKKMWTEEKTSFQGRYYCLKGAFCNPKPVQNPHPPLWISGRSEQLMLRVIAEVADGWNFFGSTEEYENKTKVRKLRKKIKKLEQGNMLFEEYIRRIHLSIIGDPERCIEKIDEYVSLGITDFMLSLPFAHAYSESLKSLQLFANYVIPSFSV